MFILIYMYIVESQGTELSELVDSVSCWWAECEMVRGRVSEMTQDLSDAYPLAGTIPVIQKQDETIQVSKYRDNRVYVHV